MLAKRSSFNLDSPNQIRARHNLARLDQWFADELRAIGDQPIQQVVRCLVDNLDAFVRFPVRAVLLWHGCDRVAPEGKRQKYHSYPAFIKDAARKLAIPLDTRPNGPAIASFLFAGGERPQRFGSTNAWNIRHLYSGKFPYLGRNQSLHAQKDGNHFSQSAGLVAIHPLADALSDELPAFSWLLRAHAFQKLAYDPDHVFAECEVDAFGFAPPKSTEIIFTASHG